MRTGKIHYAKLDTSKRLQRLLKFLKDYKWHSTLEIIKGAHICAVSTAVDELRENGFKIDCQRFGKNYYYQLAEVSQLKLF